MAFESLRNRNFAALWLAQTLSGIGGGAAQIAYPLLILALTDSVTLAGLVGTLTLVVSIAVRVPAGALSDRLDRRRTMIGCDSVRAGLLLMLGLLVLGGWALWPVVTVVAVAESAVAALFAPASMAIVPDVVEDTQLEAAWATFEGRTYVAGLVGPPLGGFLFDVASSVPFLADALGYLISASPPGRGGGVLERGGGGHRGGDPWSAAQGRRACCAAADLRSRRCDLHRHRRAPPARQVGRSDRPGPGSTCRRRDLWGVPGVHGEPPRATLADGPAPRRVRCCRSSARQRTRLSSRR